MKKKRLINLLCFGLIFQTGFAQTDGYRYYTNPDTVKKSGFYNILLSPGINAHLKTDYSDVRIIDDKSKWVPHVFHAPFYERTATAVRSDLKFTIAESNKINTAVLIETLHSVNNINVTIKNTEVSKYCSLSGSNDLQNWYVITDSVLLTPQPAEKNTERILKLNFPESNYRHLKLVIVNRNKDPFDILSVAESATVKDDFFTDIVAGFKNPKTVLQQKDSGNKSIIKISQAENFHYDRIEINCTGPKYYNRRAELYVAITGNDSTLNPGSFISSFTLSNNNNVNIAIPLQRTKVFYLIINNGDNPPLLINSVNTALSTRYITAYLEKDKAYKVIIQNEFATLPDYDITKDYPVANDSVPILGTGNILAMENVKTNTVKSSNKQWMIWLAIITALVLLLIFTKTMLKEVNKKNGE
jgi:hypothetical protein